MLNLIMVLIGGGLGAITRYLFSIKSVSIISPVLIINIAGSLLMGIFYQLFKEFNISITFIEYLIVVGFIGGFTTFGTYALEVAKLLLDSNFKAALFYAFIMNIIAIAGVFAGIVFVKYIKIYLLK